MTIRELQEIVNQIPEDFLDNEVFIISDGWVESDLRVYLCEKAILTDDCCVFEEDSSMHEVCKEFEYETSKVSEPGSLIIELVN